MRKNSEITAFAFVTGLIQSCFTRNNTYSSWASAIGALIGEEVSKQALFKRMNERTEAFALKLFSHVLSARIEILKQDRLF